MFSRGGIKETQALGHSVQARGLYGHFCVCSLMVAFLCLGQESAYAYFRPNVYRSPLLNLLGLEA